MVMLRSVLSVADNRGVELGRCIGVAKGRKWARVGDELLLRVRKGRSAWKRGQKVRGVLVRRRHGVSRGGIRLCFEENSVVLLNKTGSPVGTRLKGPLPQELRRKGQGKLFALGGIPL